MPNLTYEQLKQEVANLEAKYSGVERVLRELVLNAGLGSELYPLFGQTLKVGQVTDGNYFEVEADGSWAARGTATTWKDVDFPVVIRTAAANRPVISTLIGNLTAPKWLVDDYFVCEGQELIHDWKEGSETHWHAHVYAQGDATDSYMNWELQYTWANKDSALADVATVTSGDILIPANQPLKLMLVRIADFTPVGGKIIAHVKPRLKRIAATGAAPTNDPFCEMLQLHIECDTSGSRTEAVK